MKVILLIEDNSDNRENTRELLEVEGYEVIIAPNGTLGITLANERKPDIILCDVQMPEKDGYEVIKELGSNPATVGIPFIFLTASVERRDIEDGLELGAKAYIGKPFHPTELLETIERCLI